MVAARSARSIVGWGDWDDLVRSIDWTRVHIESQGRHLRHGGEENEVCGWCLRETLMAYDKYDLDLLGRW